MFFVLKIQRIQDDVIHLKKHLDGMQEYRISMVNAFYNKRSTQLTSHMAYLEQLEEDALAVVAGNQSPRTLALREVMKQSEADVDESITTNAICVNSAPTVSDHIRYSSVDMDSISNILSKAVGTLDIISDTVSSPCSLTLSLDSRRNIDSIAEHASIDTNAFTAATDTGTDVARTCASGNIYPNVTLVTRLEMKEREGFTQLTPISHYKAWAIQMNCKTFDHGNTCSLIRNTGDVETRLELGERCVSLAVHPTTGELYICFGDGTFRHVSSLDGKTSILFKPESRPTQIKFTLDGHVIAYSFQRKNVCVYKLDGEVVHVSIKKHSVIDLAQCPKSHNIALSCAGDGIVVLDKTLTEIQCRYNGRRMSISGHKREIFSAWTSVYDSQGNLIVGDYYNKEIHLVSGKDGTFLEEIHIPDMSKPRELCFIDDVLWIRCVDFQLICVQMK